MSDGELSTTDLLQAHGDWVRRLARHLLADPASADDVAQDTWETTLRHGPRHAGALRAWLGRIASHHVFNLARAGARRRTREGQVARDLAEQSAPSPEDLSAAVELQQQLAAIVAGLAEGQRQVVHLRYFEGLDSSEIGRRLGIPAGTVRWRLKSALEEIRARLNAGPHGDRQRWRALLLPIAATPPRALPHAGRRMWRPPVLLLAALSLPVLVTITLGLRPLGSGPGAPFAGDLTAVAGPGAGGGPRAGGPPRFRLPTSPAAALVPMDCPKLRELEEVVRVRSEELARRARHEDSFARSQPNPVAQARFGAAYDQGMRRIGKCEHTLECRGLVCKVQLLVPPGLQPWDCFPDRRETWPSDFLDPYRPSSIGNETPVVDPVSKRSFSRHDLHYRLANLAGEPVPRDGRRPSERPLAPGLGRPRAMPGGLSAGCQREARRLLDEIAALESEIATVTLPMEAFAASEPNPGAVAEVAQELARIFQLGDKALPFAIECRGMVCAVAATTALDSALAIKWDCRTLPGHGEACNPSRTEGGWAAKLDRGVRDSAVLMAGFPPHRRGAKEVPAYVRLRPAEERNRVNPRSHMCKMVDELRAAGVLESCEARHPGDKGKLTMKLTFPGPDVPLVDGRRRASVDVGDELGPTALGQCVVEGVRALMEQHEVPELRNGVVAHRNFTFPGVAHYWSKPSSCDGVKR